jgi:Flp pilus assembly protein TadG
MMSETSQRKSSFRRPWQCLGDDQGSALVEFAFVLILVLTFMFGIMDFSRFLYTDHFLSGAAREGTRYAMVRGSTWTTACASTTTFSCNASAANVISYVQGLTPPGITASSLTVLPTWPGTLAGAATACDATKGNNSPGCLVQVQVSYPYKFLFPFLPKSTLTIASTSQMVVLQ